MPARIQRHLEHLKTRILHLGAVVEDDVHQAMKALLTGDEALARRIKENDTQVDQLEIEVEEECMSILALDQPVAGDLRVVVTVLKVNNDLERIGDLAAKIADKVLLLADAESRPTIPTDLDRMYRKAVAMLKDSLDAFVKEDADLAYRVRISDDEVDQAKMAVRSYIEETAEKDPHSVHHVGILLGVARSLERIADHATNIAEDVIYMLQGKIIRHREPTEKLPGE